MPWKVFIKPIECIVTPSKQVFINKGEKGIKGLKRGGGKATYSVFFFIDALPKVIKNILLADEVFPRNISKNFAFTFRLIKWFHVEHISSEFAN